MSTIKDRLRDAAGQLGYTIRRQPRKAYPELAGVPRYVEQVVTLEGKPFRIGDAASFVAGYEEIFEDEIYRFKPMSATPRIVDCGANYGISLFYFKKTYPGCTLIGVEADPAIFATLSANVAAAGFDGVEVMNSAVSSDHEPIAFFSEGADGGRVHALDGAKGCQLVPAVTLDDLLAEPTDFLKIDIEGAETSALAACTRLDRVGQVFIEYHSFVDSGQTLSDILDLLRANGFRYYIQTQHCSPRPLTEELVNLGMDLQLNIFANRPS